MRHFTSLLAFGLALGAVAATPGMTRVFEYQPAPGQFVNTLPAIPDSVEPTAQAFAAAAQTALVDNNSMISLGAYGGYVVLGFDHPVVNVPQTRDFLIKGNAFAGSNEAGIVCVSVDVNGNGLPDDEWYELAGSEYAKPATFHGYTVTYVRPENDTDASCTGYPWVSNDQTADSTYTGEVKRNTFHKQSYWPANIAADELTFIGTRLGQYAVKSGAIWKFPSFDYGYADNLPNTSADAALDIDWAVNLDGTPVALDHIDFVKVYTGSQQCVGSVGETSTEVAGATDLHPEAQGSSEAQLLVATFDNLPLWEAESAWTHNENPEAAASGVAYASPIRSGSYEFNNLYNPMYDSWSFFAYTNHTGTTYTTFGPEQYNSAAGGAHSGQNYLLLYADTYNQPGAQITLQAEGDAVIPGTYICNSAWVRETIANGDYASGPFAAGDYLKLTLTGYTAAQVAAGESSDNTLDIYLADYRSSNPEEWTAMNTWQWVDLSPLGSVHQLKLAITSTHNDDWGMTTPGYACFDDFGATRPAAGEGAIPGIGTDFSHLDASQLSQLYDLQGRPVDRAQATHGIYLQRRGSHTSKIVL